VLSLEQTLQDKLKLEAEMELGNSLARA